MRQIESLRELEHIQMQVDIVASIIYGMGIKANLLRRDVDNFKHPSPQVLDSLIDRVGRLQIALEGCKVGMPERAGGT
jgi:hypothetical protein